MRATYIVALGVLLIGRPSAVAAPKLGLELRIAADATRDAAVVTGARREGALVVRQDGQVCAK